MPGVESSALALSAAAPGHAGTVVADSETGEVIDRQALAAYRQRLREIDAELDTAGSWNDQAGLDRLRLEREALLAEVRAATGLGGRRRRISSTEERARVAVRKTIAAAPDRIQQHDSRAADGIAMSPDGRAPSPIRCGASSAGVRGTVVGNRPQSDGVRRWGRQ